ncbi:MAG TPA: rhomboid family intramembrane serine protease [Vicinamibacterales bacterium]|nr:rhomboid family intramembrane serine protease [Vicinamibacterales bacterium]
MRPTPPGYLSYSIGPGPLTPAVRLLVILNTAAYLLGLVVPMLSIWLGLVPALVFERWWFWQPVTYMFLHGTLFHLLFNMLALWMFGVDLERRWGTRFFARFYAVCGIGAAATTLVVSLLPFGFAEQMYASVTVGASGAIYGLLVAYAMTYPNRPVYLYMLFPIPARIFVLIIGAVSFLSSVSETRGGVAHAAHLGGLLAGYLYLAGLRGGVFSLVRSQWLRWRLARMRRRFDVHEGGRKGSGGGPRVH